MSSFEKKVSELSKKLEENAAKVSSKERCVPTLLIAAILVPFIIWIALYFIQPSFVQKKEGDKNIRDGKKTFYYSLAASVFI